MTGAARKVLLRAFLEEVWSEGRADRVPQYVAETYSIFNDPGDPWDGQTLDLAGFVNRLTTSRAAAPDQRFTPVHMIAEDSQVAVAWHWSGTHLGDLPGLPASGRPITMTGLTVYMFDGALLSGHWQVADRLGVYRQLTADQG